MFCLEASKRKHLSPYKLRETALKAAPLQAEVMGFWIVACSWRLIWSKWLYHAELAFPSHIFNLWEMAQKVPPRLPHKMVIRAE